MRSTDVRMRRDGCDRSLHVRCEQLAGLESRGLEGGKVGRRWHRDVSRIENVWIRGV